MLYYGVQNITSSITNGNVDERFIAFINTVVESPVAQIAMIILLGWMPKMLP